ncbi:hypothetical protein SAMN03159382_01380 [Pseudomonas sp. NFACC23-1]|uniref:DUF6124 family protein n=1 Tax=unclassified Pseudomonas TaxID=196821 RepID=UPI000884EB11|nr:MULTISPECIES: DUF6124 family protein [unclassified Pseudomonas]SDB15176.1 hypothetical protein SAMN03159386_01040 [Pseudomonas sp. NFACC17-2]SEJ16770.1 hypothetical protein SAMN03159382_01380 [Pseudomonas sp. NFACC23-1]SFW13123.1 hypothetical protein SAMN05660640_00001 [Pseudomonas sp. NFACC16-2]
MFKVTPNPPNTDPTSPRPKTKSQKHDEVTDRVLDHYLNPKPDKPEAEPAPGQLFTVNKDIDTESLLANLSETLASANAMVNDLAFDLDGSRRHFLLGIQQLIELGSLLANRALDNIETRQST